MKKLLTINDRIKYVMTVLNFDEGQFARRVGVSKQAVINVVNKNDDPTYAMLKNIETIFPVRKEWLLIGTGNAFSVNDISKWKFENQGGENHHQVDKDINDRLRQFRESLNLSQTLFASELGLTRDVISNCENYRSSPSIQVLIECRYKFRLNIMWLLFKEGKMYEGA